VVVHTFNPSTWEAEAGGFLSSKPARATQRNPVLENRKKKKKEEEESSWPQKDFISKRQSRTD
jgi:hypothetical protein